MRDVLPEDLYRHRVPGGLDASPASDRFLASVKRADRRKDGYRTTLWAWHGIRRRIAVGSRAQPSSAKLSPAGDRIAYLGKAKKGKKQLHLQPFEGTAASVVGEASAEWQSLEQWSPDGRRLLLLRKVAWREDAFDDPDAEDRPVVATFLPYKQDGGSFRGGFRMRAVELDATTGTQRTLVEGDFDVQQARWSPDGRSLLFVRTRSGAQRHPSELWLARADGSEARCVVQRLVGLNKAVWSPDSRRIAIAASELEGDSLAELYLYECESDRLRRAASETLHLETPEPVWHPDGRRVAVVAAQRGLFEVAVVDVDSGAVQPFEGGLRHVSALCARRDGLVLATATHRRPAELFACDWDGRRLRRLSNYNRSWFLQCHRPRVEKRSFVVPDGAGGEESVEAWIIAPAHRDGPFPVYVDMHGGPQSDALIDLDNHFYWYLLLAKGWMIVAPNAVGSNGYGDAFARRLRGRWGELDLPQYLAILRTLREEDLATRPAACGGKSYGGYLAAWAAGHCEDFDAIVVSAPVADVESHFGTSDSGYYVTPYAMDGEIDAHRERYHRLSPVQDIHRSCARVLLLQGKEDQRCPLDQCEELFAALLRHGRTAKLVVYPGGSHSMAAIGRPSHRIDYHRRIVDWVESARTGEAASVPRRTDGPRDNDVDPSNMTETGSLERQVCDRGG